MTPSGDCRSRIPARTRGTTSRYLSLRPGCRSAGCRRFRWRILLCIWPLVPSPRWHARPPQRVSPHNWPRSTIWTQVTETGEWLQTDLCNRPWFKKKNIKTTTDVCQRGELLICPYRSNSDSNILHYRLIWSHIYECQIKNGIDLNIIQKRGNWK